MLNAFDGKGLEANAEVLALDKYKLILEIGKPELSQTEASLAITLIISLLKSDKLATVVRQATELGVRDIQPVITDYSDVTVLSRNKRERLQRIAVEACKQSGRSFVPNVKDAVKLEDAELVTPTLVAHPFDSNPLADYKKTDALTVVTGPEGGFSPKDLDTLKAKGATTVSLGKRILRAETAPIALIGALLIPNAL